MGKIRTILRLGLRKDTLLLQNFLFLSVRLYTPHCIYQVFVVGLCPFQKENVEYAADTNGGFKAAVCKD